MTLARPACSTQWVSVVVRRIRPNRLLWSGLQHAQQGIKQNSTPRARLQRPLQRRTISKQDSYKESTDGRFCEVWLISLSFTAGFGERGCHLDSWILSSLRGWRSQNRSSKYPSQGSTLSYWISLPVCGIDALLYLTQAILLLVSLNQTQIHGGITRFCPGLATFARTPTFVEPSTSPDIVSIPLAR